jgi:uncharacterized protein YpiB (UPF0302 family)
MLHSESQQKLEMLREQRQFFRNEVNNNKETEAEISLITRSTIRLQDDYKKLLKNVDELATEVSKLLYTYQFQSKLLLVFFPPSSFTATIFNTEAVFKHLCCNV